MNRAALALLAATLGAGNAPAQLPDPAALLGLRPPAEHHHDHCPHPAARAVVAGDAVILQVPGEAPRTVFRSDFHLRGALASPDGRLIAVVEGTGSAGDWITFLHRIDQAGGCRFIAEPLGAATAAFVDFHFRHDPALVHRPARLRIIPVAVLPGDDFQFRLTGDRDLLGRTLTLVIGEDARPVLVAGCGH